MMSTSTLPITLTGSLPDLPDVTTGLVHLGGGRYYDPAIGRPLQPNTAGAPPTMPQALNRYTAAAAGQPGVWQAERGGVDFTIAALASGFGKTLAFETAARSTTGFLGRSVVTYSGYASVAFQASGVSLTANRAAIEAAGGIFERSLENTTRLINDSSRLSKFPFRTDVYRFRAGLEQAENLAARLGTTGSLVQKGSWRTITHVDSLGLTHNRIQRFTILNNRFLGPGTDAILGGLFQYYEDRQNPYFTPQQRFARVGVTAVGNAAAGIIGTYIGASLGCGPYAPVCIAGSSLVLGAAWVFGVQPFVFNAIPGLQPPPRNLQQLAPN